MKYYCKRCKRFHDSNSKIGTKHKKFKKRINITAYRKKMEFDEGTSLPEHYKIDGDRRGDWD